MTAFLRSGTWDEMIWNGIAYEYGSMLGELESDSVVLDVGCHIGAFSSFAAARGAHVLAYEAAFENYALARINTRGLPNVEVRWAAVWRSDPTPAPALRFTPHPFVDNTGAGSVLFDDEQSLARHVELSPEPAPEVAKDALLKTRSVGSVALDDVLRELGRVRLLKIDVEGAEFPILLTANELNRVDALIAEVHYFSEEQMENLPPRSRVGSEPYRPGLLERRLGEAGFTLVSSADGCGRSIVAGRRF